VKNNASLLYNICLIAGDFLALVAAFVGAYILRVSLSDKIVANPISSETYLAVFLTLLPFWILIFALLGLYNSNIYERRFREAGRLFIGSFIGLLFVIFWSFLSADPIFPAKLVPIYGFGLAFLFLLLFRNLARLVRTSLFSFNIGLTKVVLVGNTAMTHELLHSLANSKQSGYKIMGVVGVKKTPEEHIPVYANFNQFLQSVPSDLHGIIQTELYADETKNAEILTYAQEHHINYRFVPGNSELFVGNIDVELFRNSVPVISVHHTALFGWGRIVKRLTDLFLGGFLLVLSSPLWVLCALAVKLTDPKGPVFYRAKRLTRFGSSIYVYKFRTMKQAYNNMSPEAGFTKMGRPELIQQYREHGDQLANDPRISRAGKFLRATSLDELPQLFSVVKGDISLVGPRALDVFEMEQYSKKNLILSVKSGLTGLAIVSGREGISFEERRKLDLYYVQNWSFWLDMTILAKTIRVVLERLTRRGARY
jgi:exopolysaccharide biosynthesis polyprenyl glycosylphosphotransferase